VRRAWPGYKLHEKSGPWGCFSLSEAVLSLIMQTLIRDFIAGSHDGPFRSKFLFIDEQVIESMDGVAQGVEPAKKVDCGDLLPLDQPWESGWYRKVARLRVEVGFLHGTLFH
jgi:hypothetical protein